MQRIEFRAFYLLRQTCRAANLPMRNYHTRLGMTAPRHHIPGMAPARSSIMKNLFSALILSLALTLTLASDPVVADQSDPGLDRLFEELQRTGDAAEADRLTNEIWQRWVAHDSDQRADELMRSGMGLMNRGLLAQAEQVFSTLIDARPDFAEAWNKRATIRFLRGDDAGSRQDIIRVIDLEPRHFGALSGLGMIHMRTGDLQAALQAFEAALRVNPHLDQAVDITARLRRELRGQTL